MTGFVTDEELVALYSLCKVFVFISLYEGFGIPPLEAMSCGAKVVVSNTSSLPEVVGDVGWTVDPTNNSSVKDTIWSALTYEPDNEYINKRKNHLKSYDWEALSREFERTLGL